MGSVEKDNPLYSFTVPILLYVAVYGLSLIHICKETVGEKLPTEKKNCKNKKTILTIVGLISLSMTLITIKRKEY